MAALAECNKMDWKPAFDNMIKQSEKPNPWKRLNTYGDSGSDTSSDDSSTSDDTQ